MIACKAEFKINLELHSEWAKGALFLIAPTLKYDRNLSSESSKN